MAQPIWPASWTARGQFRPAQSHPRVQRCGYPAGTDPWVALTDDGASARGTWRCESAWICPACSAVRRQDAATTIARALGARGGYAQMVTLTIRHDHTVSLRLALEALTETWIAWRHHGSVTRWYREHVRGSARAVEITRGSHGWHPHVHLLLMLDTPLEVQDLAWTGTRDVVRIGRERDWIAELWARAASRGPCASPSWTPTWLSGVHISRAADVSRETSAASETATQYVTKAGLEISGQGKASSPSSLWRVAARAARGDDAARRLWREIGDATRGRHAIHLDPRLRGLAEYADARDEQAARRDGEMPRETQTRAYVVPFLRHSVLSWLERAWSPAALRAPVRLAQLGHDPAGWSEAAQRAYAARDPAILAPWTQILQIDKATTQFT